MRKYEITNEFIYKVKHALNTIFLMDSATKDNAFNVVVESFSKYFNNDTITTEKDSEQRTIKLKLNNLFINNQGEIRVDVHDYNEALRRIDRAHTDAMNAILNNNKDNIYIVLKGDDVRSNTKFADLFLETIPVVASQISTIWGHPVLDKGGIIVNIRLY